MSCQSDNIQPPPSSVQHIYTFPESLARYNLPLPEILARVAPDGRDRIAVGAFVFFTSSTQTKELPSPKLLLIRRSAHEAAFPQAYEVPGGGAEAPPTDKTLLDSVARELYEETGLVAKRIRRFIDFKDFEGRRGDKWRKYNFEVEVVVDSSISIDREEGGVEGNSGSADGDDAGLDIISKQIVLQPAEHDEYKWVTWEELKEEERQIAAGEDSWLSRTLVDQKRSLHAAFSQLLSIPL